MVILNKLWVAKQFYTMKVHTIYLFSKWVNGAKGWFFKYGHIMNGHHALNSQWLGLVVLISSIVGLLIYI